MRNTSIYLIGAAALIRLKFTHTHVAGPGRAIDTGLHACEREIRLCPDFHVTGMARDLHNCMSSTPCHYHLNEASDFLIQTLAPLSISVCELRTENELAFSLMAPELKQT